MDAGPLSTDIGTSWSTADASDVSFMTPGRLNVIRLLVEHPHISLYSLNAPQEAMNGATPLGVATWLNAPEIVRILIETSASAVSVNGMDGHGATALMCKSRTCLGVSEHQAYHISIHASDAARDGTVELVKFLVCHLPFSSVSLDTYLLICDASTSCQTVLGLITEIAIIIPRSSTA